MSTMVKVMCECCDDDDEANLRVAEMKSDWEDTSTGWKIVHILLIIPMVFWVGVILAKIFLRPKVIVCLNCGEYLGKSDIRGIS